MYKKLISVVIPTKNRYNTLFSLIKAIEPICKSHGDLEVIVQDNSDDNKKAVDFFGNLKESNIKYFYESKWLSVGDNSDLAIMHSCGEYVSFIGDDDAFTESIIEIASYMKRNDIDACGCDYSLYRWPAALMSGKYSLEYTSHGAILRYPNVHKEMNNIMKNGIQSKKNLPCVYHGLIKRSVLDIVYRKTGTYFPGPSPDMANSFALSVIVNKYVVTTIPFIIDGYSKASTGHLSEIKAHIGKLEDMTFLPKDTVQNWSEIIPRIWLPNTIWPESALQALKRMGRDDLLKQFNHTAMYIKIGKFYPQCKELCSQYIDRYSGRFNYLLTYLFVACVYIRNRLFDYIGKRRCRIATRIETELTIREAIESTTDIILLNEMLKSIK